MVARAQPPRPLPPGQHGVPRGYDCAICRTHAAAYPPALPRGWEVDEHGRAWCPRCTRPRRRP